MRTIGGEGSERIPKKRGKIGRERGSNKGRVDNGAHSAVNDNGSGIDPKVAGAVATNRSPLSEQTGTNMNVDSEESENDDASGKRRVDILLNSEYNTFIQLNLFVAIPDDEPPT